MNTESENILVSSIDDMILDSKKKLGQIFVKASEIKINMDKKFTSINNNQSNNTMTPEQKKQEIKEYLDLSKNLDLLILSIQQDLITKQNYIKSELAENVR